MNHLLQKLPTLILRIIVLLSAFAGVLMCIVTLPPFGMAIAQHFPEYAFWQYPILVGLYAAAACFFFALFHFWLLFNSIDRNESLAVKNLKAIRWSSIIFSVLYFVFAMPIIFLAADANDAPGGILIGAFLGALPIGVTAVAVILERFSEKNNSLIPY